MLSGAKYKIVRKKIFVLEAVEIHKHESVERNYSKFGPMCVNLKNVLVVGSEVIQPSLISAF
jgi:hypothetical protein